MVLGGMLVLVAGIVVGRRLEPTARAVPRLVLAGLATLALAAFASAAIGMLAASSALTGAGLAATGVTAGSFLWLVRGGPDDDDGDDEDDEAPPEAPEWARFGRKSTPRVGAPR